MNTRTHSAQGENPFSTRLPARRRTLWLALGFFILSLPLTLAQDVLMGLTSNGGAEGRGTVFSLTTAGANFSVVKGFADWGKGPQGDLMQWTDGNFYGMTETGGTHDYGTLFRMTPGGQVTILRHFEPATDGGSPRGGLTAGTDGHLYGSTRTGGSGNYGTIFKFNPVTNAYTVIKHLYPSADGGNPQENLVRGSDGNFYGTTYMGGAKGYGTIFRINPSTKAYAVLHSFTGAATGQNPMGSLVRANNGNFYGTTYQGGSGGIGVIFRISQSGSFSVVRHLKPADGGYNRGSLTLGNDGNLYGLGFSGGSTGGGTIFRLNPVTNAYTVMRNLSGADGLFPNGSLVKASNGTFYGMMTGGGANSAGTIFKYVPGGTYTVLRALNQATDGGYPNGSLIRGTDGSFYGMTSTGGGNSSANSLGTLFKINPAVSPAAFTVMIRFDGSAQGNAPGGSLVQASNGAFYGTTSAGGATGHGTIFKICGGVTTVVRSLNRTTDGAKPMGTLIQGKDGNLYGTTSDGGANVMGTIFKINPTTNAFTVIKHLAAADGAYPLGSLTQGTDGKLYGLATRGGNKNGGTIFRIDPTTNAFTVLRHFDYTVDGAYPEGNLVQANDGNFYGMLSSNSRIFRVKPDGTFSSVLILSYNTQGGSPSGSLIKGSATDPYLYGMTTYGGSKSGGTVFKINPATKAVSVLRHLNLTTDGGYPKGNLVRDSNGNLYGMTQKGGTNKVGTIFRISSAGTFSVLRHLNLKTDGGTPLGSLIIRKANPLVAKAQAVTTTEDVARAITLSGSGGSPLTYNIVSGPKYGKLTGTGSARTYTPFANVSGSDSFTFVVTMGCVSSPPATVTISVSSVNDAPVLAAITNKTIVKGKPLTFTAAATDADAGQTKTFSLVSPPAGATIGSTTGNFSWTPANTGTYTLTVKVTDNGSPVLSSQKSFTVTVTSTTARVASADDFEAAALSTARLFPNPVAGALTVQLDGPAAQVQGTVITDATGKAHLTNAHRVQSENELGIDVSGLQEGLYLLRLQTPQGNHTLRFLKQ